ncbi:MAG TPA: hypothetical protein VKU03_12430 [Roseiarcus sp.]|nr:hypothetical protein [Roseiarcus sp.]
MRTTTLDRGDPLYRIVMNYRVAVCAAEQELVRQCRAAKTPLTITFNVVVTELLDGLARACSLGEQAETYSQDSFEAALIDGFRIHLAKYREKITVMGARS